MPQGKNKSDLDEIRSMGHSKPRKKAAQKKEPQEPLEPKKFRTYTKAELKSRLKEFIARRTSSRREVQTFSVMMVSSLLLILGMPLHFLNVVGSSAPFPMIMSIAMWLVAIAVFLVATFKKDINTALLQSVFSILILLFTSIKVMWFVDVRPQGFLYNLLFNEVNGLITVLVLVMAYIRWVPYVATAINILSLCYAYFSLHFEGLLLFLVLIALVEIFMCMLGSLLNFNYGVIESQYNQYLADQEKLLRATGLSLEQLKAYVNLSFTDNPSPTEIDRFFDALTPTSQYKIIHAVHVRENDRAANIKTITDIWPQFTPTEAEVSWLLARGKVQREIAWLLRKTENNVGTVRIHIRHKLGLAPSENLRNVLVAGIAAHQEAQKAGTSALGAAKAEAPEAQDAAQPSAPDSPNARPAEPQGNEAEVQNGETLSPEADEPNTKPNTEPNTQATAADKQASNPDEQEAEAEEQA